MLKINGWTLYAHPLFLDQLDRLIKAVESEKQKNPDTYRGGNNAKLLASIDEIAFKRIPADPTDKRYRQGSTLGNDYKHWFRDKFGNGRFRLFFRYDSKAKLIIYAWVNDDDSKRTYGSKNDAYAVFKKMLDAGNPPDNWDKLLSQCSADQLAEVISKADDL
jgi:toxin YhaV